MDKRTLSAAQQEAVEHCYGPRMVIAGPGSGKTFVITKRLEHMIKVHGIRPEEILVITFTKAAATEMQTRFMTQMADETLPVTFGTFHSVFFGILKKAFNYTASDILTEKAKHDYLKSVISVYPDISDDMIDGLISRISKIKNDGICPEDFDDSERVVDKETFCRIFYDYAKILESERKLDFDDMVLLCRRLFLCEPDILEHWQDRFRFILIDEFQDINPMQYEVVKMLAAPFNNLFVVGDDDQSIYGFRGSRPGIMLGFNKEFKDASTTVLSDNYRCRGQIVKLAGKVISNNKARFDKKLKAIKPGSKCVAILPFDDKEAEADAVTRILESAMKHIPSDDIAIICRTNTGAAKYSCVLAGAGIPFVLKEKVMSIFSSPEAKDILSMFSYAHGERSRENLLRFMNKPPRYIRRCDLEDRNCDLEDLLANPELKDYVKNKIRGLIYDMGKLKEMHPYAGINYILKGMGYEKYFFNEGKKKGKSREDIIELLNRISDTARNVDDYDHWLERIKEYEDMVSECEQRKNAHGVCLSTMHGSKGLEYSLVIIPDINEGNIPWKKCETAEEIEEERRVFYVAITRAKEKLVLCYLKKNNDNKTMPSRFLTESRLI